MKFPECPTWNIDSKKFENFIHSSTLLGILDASLLKRKNITVRLGAATKGLKASSEAELRAARVYRWITFTTLAIDPVIKFT